MRRLEDIQTDQDVDDYIRDVEEDHYLHRLAHILVGVWAGWVWGWVWGVALYFGLFLIIAISNPFVLAVTGKWHAMRINRWAWLGLASALIVVTTVTVYRGS